MKFQELLGETAETRNKEMAIGSDGEKLSGGSESCSQKLYRQPLELREAARYRHLSKSRLVI